VSSRSRTRRVSDWHKQWKVGGKQALKRTGQPGRPRKVTDADLAKVERALQKGPKANGYPTDLWTLARVAEVIEKTTGVTYHPGHAGRCSAEWAGADNGRLARPSSGTTSVDTRC
jgi:transposase